ncbi:MAG TPA: GrlR family regulatory protein [Acidobacteriaceae bacterium]
MHHQQPPPGAESADEFSPAAGFWLAQFTSLSGIGRGVVTLADGKVYGGDSGYLYIGGYQQQGETVSAQIHVSSFQPRAHSVMGQEHSERFDLILTSTVAGKVITASGFIPGTTLSFQAVLLCQELPESRSKA